MLPEVNPDMIGLADLARETGRSVSSLCHLVARGRLTVFPGRRVHRGVALAELAKLRPRSEPRRASATAPAAPAAVQAVEASSPAPAAGDPYAVSRARREAAAAEREELALQRERREALPRAEVFDAIADAAATFRGHFEAMPDRLAATLVGQDEARIRSTLHDEVHRALSDLAARMERLSRGDDEA